MAFTNRDRLRRRLKAIAPEVRKAARAQLKVNAEELVETIKGFAPERDGDLKASIRQQDVSTSGRISRRVSEGGKRAPHAVWVEFGRKDAPPESSGARPHFWPAWRLKRRRFRARMTRAAKRALATAVSK